MELSEITKFVDDVMGTQAFYETVLDRAPSHTGDGIATFQIEGVTLLIHETYDADEHELPPEDHVSFAVDNLDEEFERLVENGLTTFREPAEYDWGRSAYFRTPAGQLVEITEL